METGSLRAHQAGAGARRAADFIDPRLVAHFQPPSSSFNVPVQVSRRHEGRHENCNPSSGFNNAASSVGVLAIHFGERTTKKLLGPLLLLAIWSAPAMTQDANPLFPTPKNLKTTDCFERYLWQKWSLFFAQGRFNDIVDIPDTPLQAGVAGAAPVWSKYTQSSDGSQIWDLLDGTTVVRKPDGTVSETSGTSVKQICPPPQTVNALTTPGTTPGPGTPGNPPPPIPADDCFSAADEAALQAEQAYLENVQEALRRIEYNIAVVKQEIQDDEHEIKSRQAFIDTYPDDPWSQGPNQYFIQKTQLELQNYEHDLELLQRDKALEELYKTEAEQNIQQLKAKLPCPKDVRSMLPGQLETEGTRYYIPSTPTDDKALATVPPTTDDKTLATVPATTPSASDATNKTDLLESAKRDLLGGTGNGSISATLPSKEQLLEQAKSDAGVSTPKDQLLEQSNPHSKTAVTSTKALVDEPKIGSRSPTSSTTRGAAGPNDRAPSVYRGGSLAPTTSYRGPLR